MCVPVSLPPNCSLMPLSALHTVELQLIMQLCDRSSLLTFARCCQHTLAAASADFAWRSLSPVSLRWSGPGFAAHVAASLLRHADIAICVGGGGFVFHSDSEIVEAIGIPRIRSLSWRTGETMQLADFTAMAEHPNASRLTSLALSVPLGPSHFELINGHMPQLQTLRCTIPPADLEVWFRLATFPHLTAINVSAPISGGLHAGVVLAECKNLSSLTLRDWDLSDVAELLAHTGLASRLRSLTLETPSMYSDIDHLPVSTFLPLTSLHTLTFRAFSERWDEDGFSAVMFAPSLRRLRLECDIRGTSIERCATVRMDFRPFLPSRRDLEAAILERNNLAEAESVPRPPLRIELVLPNRAFYFSWAWDPTQAQVHCDLVLDDLHPLRAPQVFANCTVVLEESPDAVPQ